MKKQENNGVGRKLFLQTKGLRLIKKTLKSEHVVRTYRRALSLSLLDKGRKAVDIERDGVFCVATLRALRNKYYKGGLELALYDKQRPGKPSRIGKHQTQKVVALACTQAPEGAARMKNRFNYLIVNVKRLHRLKTAGLSVLTMSTNAVALQMFSVL